MNNLQIIMHWVAAQAWANDYWSATWYYQLCAMMHDKRACDDTLAEAEHAYEQCRSHEMAGVLGATKRVDLLELGRSALDDIRF